LTGGPFIIWILIIITAIFLFIAGACVVYLLIGVELFVIGYKERNYSKIKSGLISLGVSSSILIIAMAFYLQIINA